MKYLILSRCLSFVCLTLYHLKYKVSSFGNWISDKNGQDRDDIFKFDLKYSSKDLWTLMYIFEHRVKLLY